MARTLNVVWTDLENAYERQVASLNEGLNLVDQLRSTLPIPAMVQFYASDSTPALSLGVGRKLTVITFETSIDPPYFISLADVDQDGEIEFCYGNELTEYSLMNAVPWEVGREALSYFVEHERKPTNLRWENL